MSGVYIKGMEMPTSCAKCKLFGEYGCAFIGAVGYALTEGRRSKDCPLVPVPPHGRLIDADALKLSHCKECTLYPDKCLEKTDEGCDWDSIYHIEHCAPTIIPAEEEDNG